ncbi:conserved hypothetical protein [Hyella patelloides LEGE 07179]|uniref:SnoaL-like domain-containing protein n=1 Tax=Hyella patelloides LEGE 07179 TaxID=945734 RepID=A0A563VS00_9CYAN|nr:nuclear transport factor 2 family protein [Hyella patelloides]VEP14195.1 conserved hypothetical protein [Hyella patelloides LEGE 07179]
MNSGTATQAMVQRQAEAWETGNVSGIVNDFAPNAVFIAGGFKFQGVEAIEKAATDYFRQFTDTKVTIKRIILSDTQGAVEWDWSDRNIQSDTISRAEDAIIFELQDDGKIIYWREYIEKVSG